MTAPGTIGRPVQRELATRHEYAENSAARLSVLDALSLATEEGPKRQQIVYPDSSGRHIATGVSSYNYGRIMKAVRENDNGWGSNFFSFLFKYMWINLFCGTLKSNTMKLADAVFKGDEESKKAFAVINNADGRLARALVMLAYENKVAGRLAVGVDSHTLGEIVRKFVAHGGSGYSVLRHDEVDRTGLNRLLAGYKQELLGNYLARLGGETRKSQLLNILTEAVQTAFDAAGEVPPLGSVLPAESPYLLSQNEAVGACYSLELSANCLRGSLAAFGRMEAYWLLKGDLLALRSIFDVAHWSEGWAEGCQVWGPELAKNLIRRLAYGIDPDFAVANREDLAALRKRIYTDALLREDRVSVDELIRNREDQSLVEVLDAFLINPPAEISPRRLQDLKWAFCKMVGDAANPSFASKVATYRAELVAAEYLPALYCTDNPRRDEIRLRHPALSQLFQSSDVHVLEQLSAVEAELAKNRIENFCSYELRPGAPVSPERQANVDYGRRIATGEVPSDPQVRAVVATHVAIFDCFAGGDRQHAIGYWAEALKNGNDKAAIHLAQMAWRPEFCGKAVDALIAQRHIHAAAATLYQLTARGNVVAAQKLRALADEEHPVSAEHPAGADHPDPLANQILGMVFEFGSTVMAAREMGPVRCASNFTEAARRYERGGCKADLLGMAQAGHAEALHILEQRPLVQKAGAVGYRLKLALDADANDRRDPLGMRERVMGAVTAAIEAPKEE